MINLTLPPDSIVEAHLIESRPNVAEVSFDTPESAVLFLAKVREQTEKRTSRYLYVILNEEVGGRSFAHHRILAAEQEDDVEAMADLMAATLDGEPDEDAMLPPKSGRGYELESGSRIISVLKIEPIPSAMGRQLAQMLPVVHAEDLRHLKETGHEGKHHPLPRA